MENIVEFNKTAEQPEPIFRYRITPKEGEPFEIDGNLMFNSLFCAVTRDEPVKNTVIWYQPFETVARVDNLGAVANTQTKISLN